MKQLFNKVWNTKKKKRNKNEYIETREVDTSREVELTYFDYIDIRVDEFIEEKERGRKTSQLRQRWTIKIPKTEHEQTPADKLLRGLLDQAIKYRDTENNKTKLSGGHMENHRHFDNVLMDFVKTYDHDFVGTNYQPVKKLAE